MKITIHLVNNSSAIIDETEFPSDNLTKATMESFLQSTYQLSSGYEITYFDLDGDEIMVQYDDDYQVAKLTHQQHHLILTVKISNQQWLSQFGHGNQQSSQQLNIEQSLNEDQKTQKIPSSIDLDQSVNATTSEKNFSSQLISQEKKQSIMENTQNIVAQQEKMTAQASLFEQQELKRALQERKLQQQISQNKQQIKTKPLLSLKKKTQTQHSSQRESEQENDLLLPLVNTKTAQLTTQLSPQQETPSSIIDKQTIVEEKPQKKKQLKKPKKEKKQSSPKPQKENLLNLTQKQLQKLIKKSVIQLIPQISQQLNKINQKQCHVMNISKENFQKLTALNCTICEKQLTVPFYINSSQGLKLCETCQELDQSIVPLIKIRDPKMIENLIWAEPLCQLAKTPQINAVKFYTDMKKSLQSNLKQKMDKCIKQAKAQMKSEKVEQKIKKNKEKSTKNEKQHEQNPDESICSSI